VSFSLEASFASTGGGTKRERGGGRKREGKRGLQGPLNFFFPDAKEYDKEEKERKGCVPLTFAPPP